VAHHTAQLYHVDAFIVSCVATITLGSQVGEIWSGTRTIGIWDDLDRHHSYVEWGPNPVYFISPEGSAEMWWVRNRKSRIHRTAVSARCKMLRMAASDPKGKGKRAAAG